MDQNISELGYIGIDKDNIHMYDDEKVSKKT